jgi:hypothetical protein
MQIDLPERRLPRPGGNELLGVLGRGISGKKIASKNPNPKNQIPRKLQKPNEENGASRQSLFEDWVLRFVWDSVLGISRRGCGGHGVGASMRPNADRRGRSSSGCGRDVHNIKVGGAGRPGGSPRFPYGIL